MSFRLIVVAVLLVGIGALPDEANSIPQHHIKYFERLSISSLLRPTRGQVTENAQITLPISAYGSLFHLRLYRNERISSNVELLGVDDEGTHQMKLPGVSFYTGGFDEEEGSMASFRVGNDLRIRGVVYTKTHSYHIEPKDDHFLQFSQSFDHIIYRLADFDEDMTNSHDMVATAPANWNDVDETQENSNNNIHSDSDMKHHIDDSHAHGNNNNNNNNNNDNIFSMQQKQRQRRSYTKGNTACRMALVADYFFFTASGSSNYAKTVEVMLQIFQTGQMIFTSTPFTNASTIDINQITVYQTSSSSPFGSATTAPDFLNSVTSSDWSKYCLAHVITSQNFNGILGLAWRGYPADQASAGGICQTRSGSSYYNSAISTTNNFGSTYSLATYALVFTHEVGHNFGSGHDATNTNPPANGNFIMYPYANSGTLANNFLFSPETIVNISATVYDKSSCFAPPSQPVCGNDLVEQNEQCDSGNDPATCLQIDPCCSVYGTGRNCLIRQNLTCSPLNPASGVCCTSSCSAQPTSTVCIEATECSLPATCQSNGTCPTQAMMIPNSNQKPCDSNAKLCSNGACSLSICSIFGSGLQQCSLNVTSLGCRVACISQITSQCTLVENLQDTISVSNNPYNYQPDPAGTFDVDGSSCYYISTDPNSGFCIRGQCMSAGGENAFQNSLNNFANEAKAIIISAIRWALMKSGGVPNWGWLLIGLGVLFVISYFINRYRDKLANAAQDRQNKKHVYFPPEVRRTRLESSL